MGLLIAFAGLPGSGKSAIAQELALRTGATWLRADSIEQAIKDSGVVPGDMKDAGYRVAQAVAADNLRLGRDVVADCVNDWKIARDGWQAVGLRAGVEVVWVEIVCSDPAEHRRRVETRLSQVPGLELPDWQAVIEREYHDWDRERLTVDTAGRDASGVGRDRPGVSKEPAVIEASCHCGAVRFAVETAPVDLNDCNCSICRRYGTLWAYYQKPEVRFDAGNGPTDVYIWGDRMLEFHRCHECGCVIHWVAIDQDYTRMGVNARLMAPEVLATTPVRHTNGAAM